MTARTIQNLLADDVLQGRLELFSEGAVDEEVGRRVNDEQEVVEAVAMRGREQVYTMEKGIKELQVLFNVTLHRYTNTQKFSTSTSFSPCETKEPGGRHKLYSRFFTSEKKYTETLSHFLHIMHQDF